MYNTIILIDNSQKRKNYFIEQLKQKINFSYTKLEALLKTVKELTDKESCEFEAKQYINFLDHFLTNLGKKEEMYLIDIDELQIENANRLIEKHDNIIIIYLQPTNNEKIISVDGDNNEEIAKLIERIVNR